MEKKELITRAYAAFNSRDIDGALTLMSERISWPKASEGGRADSKNAIRDYWSRQWQEFNPTVEPVETTEQPDGTVKVRVHQLVKSLAGDVLFDGEVFHVYTFANGLIERMDFMEGSAKSGANPSAFSKR